MTVRTKTRTALLESIEKWRQIERGEMIDDGINNCPLCMEFYDTGAYFCQWCPVTEVSCVSCCYNTPYVLWARMLSCFEERTADTPKRVAAAHAEYLFLKEVLRAFDAGKK